MTDNPEGATVRFAVPSGNTRAEMREWLKSSDHGKALYAYGDCLLVWANEGDLFRRALPAADTSALGAEAMREAARDLVMQCAGVMKQFGDMNSFRSLTSAAAAIDAITLPDHAAQLAAALKLPEVVAMRTALQEIIRQFGDTPNGHMAAQIARKTLSALEARHDPA